MFTKFQQLMAFIQENKHEKKIILIIFFIFYRLGKIHYLTLLSNHLTYKSFKKGLGLDYSSYNYINIKNSNKAFISDIYSAFIIPIKNYSKPFKSVNYYEY